MVLEKIRPRRYEYQKAYFEKNQERLQQNRRLWYAKNKDKVNANRNSDEQREKNRVHYAQNKEKIRARKRKTTKLQWLNNYEKMKMASRKQQLKRRYGISIEDYARMYDEQWGMCAICGKHMKSSVELKTKTHEVLHVDHCHKTKKARALLCSPCNTALGLLKDSETILENAINYLKYFN